jgi:hypothetical protein
MLPVSNRRTLIALLAGSVLAYVLIPAIMLVNRSAHLVTSQGNPQETSLQNSTLINAKVLMGGAVLFFKHYTNSEQDSDN